MFVENANNLGCKNQQQICCGQRKPGKETDEVSAKEKASLCWPYDNKIAEDVT